MANIKNGGIPENTSAIKYVFIRIPGVLFNLYTSNGTTEFLFKIRRGPKKLDHTPLKVPIDV